MGFFDSTVLIMSDHNLRLNKVSLTKALPEGDEASRPDVGIRYKVIREDKTLSPVDISSAAEAQIISEIDDELEVEIGAELDAEIEAEIAEIAEIEAELEAELEAEIEAEIAEIAELEAEIEAEIADETEAEIADEKEAEIADETEAEIAEATEGKEKKNTGILAIVEQKAERDVKSSDSSMLRQLLVSSFTEGYAGTVIYALGLSLTIVGIIFFVLNYSVIIKTPSSTTQLDSTLESKPLNSPVSKSKLLAAKPNKPINLEMLVSNLMRDEKWDIQKIHFFKNFWLKKDYAQQLAAREETWFQSFESKLAKELTKYKGKKVSSNQLDAARKFALIDLANMLNNTNSGLVSSEKPIIEKSEIPNNKISEITGETVTPSNIQKSGQKLDLDVALSQLSNVEQNNHKPDKRPEAKPVINTEESNNTSVDPDKNKYIVNGLVEDLRKNTDPNKPTYSELHYLILKFINYYESGDLKKMKSLFAIENNGENREDLAELDAEFEDLFNNSSDRQMFVSGLKWSIKDNQAIGNGKLEVIILSDSEPHVLSRKSKIQFVTTKQNDEIYITEFQQSDY